MQFLHGTHRRDLEVVAADGRILADVVPEDIGHFIEGELAAAAARLVRTGKSQRFVEISKDYPQGIRQVAVPIRRAGRIDGLIILEYTPLYDRILADSAATNRVEAAGVVLIVLVTAGLGLYTARLVGREAKARSESAQLRAVAHLANAAAHEINNPMTTVIGRLSMLAERLPAQSREVELVQIAQTESARVTKMIEHMQNITQLEYLAMAGPELPRTLDIKKSAGDRAQALKHR
jgi:signal transduction histidine kinase